MRKPVLVLAVGSCLLAPLSSVQATHQDEIHQVRLECPRFVEEILPPIEAPARQAASAPAVVEKLDVVSTGLEVEYRLFAPAATHWGQASFTSAVTLGASKELKAWFDEAAAGKGIRKHVSVTVPETSQTPGRSYVLYDCLAVSWTGGSVSAEGAADADTIAVQAKRINFRT